MVLNFEPTSGFEIATRLLAREIGKDCWEYERKTFGDDI